MNRPLDDLYLEYLYRQVASVKDKNRSRTYWDLMRHLYRKEFIWLIPNDDNRVEDGRDIRYEFLDWAGLSEDDVDSAWMRLGCSMLEMLLGLSKRLSFEAEGKSRDWFWHLIETLDIRYSDADYQSHREIIDETLDRVIWRQYESDGKGGLFPLNRTRHDQRYVEIWYQLNAYLQEL